MESSSRFYTDLGFARLEKAIATIYVVEPNGPAVLLPPTVVGYSFSFDLVKSPSAYYYITLTVTDYSIDGIVHSMDSRDVTLIAVFKGSDVGATISLRSTIANAYAFAQMLRFNNDGRKVTLAGTERALRIAFGMRENLAVTTGAVSHVISRPPNGLETNSYTMFNTLSSLVYYNITDAAFYKSFLGFTSANSFLEGLLNLVWNPFTNAQEIYNLVAGKAAIYEPSLPSMKLPPHKSPVPNQWTLTIKVNDSGARNFLMAGLAYVVFDKEDKAWISNNFRQGSAFSGTHCIVLNADGTACGFSPIMGGGILGPGFGAAVDPSGETIAFGNFGWGPELFNPQSGSVSMFSYKGEALSPPNGFTQYLSRVQGMCYDSNGHLWMASVGSQEPFAPDTPTGVYPFESANSALVVYLHGNPQLALSFSNFLGAPSPYHNTFDVTIDKEGNAIVSNIGDKDKGVPSSVHKIKLDGERLVCLASWVSDYENPRTGLTGYEELRQVVVNKKNEVLVVGITSSRVVKLCPDLKKITTYTKNIYAPWGITLDGAGTMFIANFAQEKGRETSIDTWDMQGPYGVTVIRNEDEETAALMTLPTGGNEVTLRNGHPLYGTMEVNGQSVQWPSYEPIMRLTSTGIDAAGNVWAVNNWKPSAAVDVLTNPGGDGVVIFVGAAKPVSSP